MSALLSVHLGVQIFSEAPAHEPDGAGQIGRCRVLERDSTILIITSEILMALVPLLG